MHLTLSWVQLLSNKLEFFVSCNIKIRRTLSFCSVLAHFYENLIVLHHGDNNFLFYFDMCIKFTLLTITQRWRNDNILLDICFKTTFHDKKIWEKKNNRKTLTKYLHNKTIHCHSKIQGTAKSFKRIKKFRSYFRSVNLSMRCWLMLFKIGALKNLVKFTEKHLCWPLQAFFYWTPTVAASEFSR